MIDNEEELELYDKRHQQLVDWVRDNKLRIVTETELLTRSIEVRHGYDPPVVMCDWSKDELRCSGVCERYWISPKNGKLERYNEAPPDITDSKANEAARNAQIAYANFVADLRVHAPQLTDEFLSSKLLVKEEVPMYHANWNNGFVDSVITLDGNRIGGTTNPAVKGCQFYAYAGRLKYRRVMIEVKSSLPTRAKILRQINKYKSIPQGRGYWILLTWKGVLSDEEKKRYIDQSVTPYEVEEPLKA